MKTGLLLLFFIQCAVTAPAQSGGVTAPGYAPATISGKKVKTRTVYSYTPEGKSEKYYTDSFSSAGLKIKWTNHIDVKYSPVYPGYTIRYNYDSLRNIKYVFAGSSDTLFYRYNSSDSSTIKYERIEGKLTPSEKFIINEFHDTILYLHYNSGQATDGWKIENEYRDGKKKSGKYYNYVVNFYGDAKNNVHPRWELQLRSQYYYSSHDLADSIIYYDKNNILFKREVFHYNSNNLLSKKEIFFAGKLTTQIHFIYNGNGQLSRMIVLSPDKAGNEIKTKSRWKYNKSGLMTGYSMREGKNTRNMAKYKYTYY